MQSSIWFETAGSDRLRFLRSADPFPRTADVAIVGAGMIGLAIAHFLVKAGISDICVIDRDAACAEASGANAGGLWFAHLASEMGSFVQIAKASSRLYDGWAAEFDFDFRRTGMLELLYNGAETVDMIRQAGFRAERVSAQDLQGLEPSLAPGPAAAILYPDEGQLHPVKLGAELVRQLKTRRVRFCFGAEVTAIQPRVETSFGPLDAGTVVIACGAWTPLVTRTLGWQPPIRPVKGHLLATTPLPPALRHTIVGKQFYHWQLPSGHVAGGGTIEDVGFDRSIDPATVAGIREEMNSLFPPLSNVQTACAWSGFRPFCEDLRPVIGKVPGQDRVYVAAGHFKKGIMLAPVTGKIVADLIAMGRTDLPAEVFHPGRFS